MKETQYISGNWPAFPMSPVYNPVSGKLEEEGTCGLTLREWYAGMALQGLLACPDTTGNIEEVVKDSFKCADEMIKASHE